MLNLAGITGDSIVDGPGIRTTVFCQGCSHHCPGCQNPETWTFNTGTDVSVEQVLEIIHANPLCRGVTFSGGEPFSQAEEMAHLGKILKDEGYEIAVYSGYTFEELLVGAPSWRRLLEVTDVLIDGRFMLAMRSLELNFRGSTNQRVLNVPDSLREGRAILETSKRWLGEY